MRTITFKSPDIMVPLYKALIRPILEYGNPIWCPRFKKDIDDIEAIQHFYTKRIIGLSHLDYEPRLRKLKLPSLSYRRLRGDLIEVFKITHKFYDPLTTKNLFHFDIANEDVSSNTRSNGFKITKLRTNTARFEHFFTNRIVNPWNSLPANVVNVKTVNAFKNALDRHLKARMYDERVEYK